jgi:hypothetical protein
MEPAMGKRTTPGESAIQRLNTLNEGGVRRRTMVDGGQVYSGPTATRALRALGARAMTLDKDIFVAEDFDDSDAEDQALYAHERHHQMEHGRVDAGAHSYAEEKAAQTIERMVLHRSKKGDSFGSIMRDVNSGKVHRDANTNGAASSASSVGAQKLSRDMLERTVQLMMNRGKSYEDIVTLLSEHVVESLDSANRVNAINRN